MSILGSNDENTRRVVTASKDRTLRLWKVARRFYFVLSEFLFFFKASKEEMREINILLIIFFFFLKFDVQGSMNHPVTINASKVLRGHSAAIECVSCQPNGNMVFIFEIYKVVANIWYAFILSFCSCLACKFRFVLVPGILQLIYGKPIILTLMVTPQLLKREKQVVF